MNLSIKVVFLLTLFQFAQAAFSEDLCLQFFPIDPAYSETQAALKQAMAGAQQAQPVIDQLWQSLNIKATPSRLHAKSEPVRPAVPPRKPKEILQLEKLLVEVAPDLLGKNFDPVNEAHWNQLVKDGRMFRHFQQFLNLLMMNESQIRAETSDDAIHIFRTLKVRLTRIFNDGYYKLDDHQLSSIEAKIIDKILNEKSPGRLARLLDYLVMLDFATERQLVAYIQKRAVLLKSDRLGVEERETIIIKIETMISRQINGLERFDPEAQLDIFERFSHDFGLIELFVAAPVKLIDHYVHFFKTHLAHLNLRKMKDAYLAYQMLQYFYRHDLEREFVLNYLKVALAENKIDPDARALFLTHLNLVMISH